MFGWMRKTVQNILTEPNDYVQVTQGKIDDPTSSFFCQHGQFFEKILTGETELVPISRNIKELRPVYKYQLTSQKDLPEWVIEQLSQIDPEVLSNVGLVPAD